MDDAEKVRGEQVASDGFATAAELTMPALTMSNGNLTKGSLEWQWKTNSQVSC